MTRPAFRCPSCGRQRVEVLLLALWDGEDLHGQAAGGMVEYGTCIDCHSRCARHNNAQPFIPTEEEWQNSVVLIEKHRQLKEHGNADGLLVIESFNGHEKQAALVLRSALRLTPADALALVRDENPEIPWSWKVGMSPLFELKERLDSIGVTSRIERIGRR